MFFTLYSKSVFKLFLLSFPSELWPACVTVFFRERLLGLLVRDKTMMLKDFRTICERKLPAEASTDQMFAKYEADKYKHTACALVV